MKELDNYYNLIEEAIKGLGVDPEKCVGKTKGQWNLQKGSVSVWLDVWHIEKEDRAYFQAISPVMRIPTNRKEEFFEELLSLNHSLFGVSFTIYNGNVWLKAIREVDGLDKNEAMFMTTRIGNYSDHYDDILKEKYFGSDEPIHNVVGGPPPTMH